MMFIRPLLVSLLVFGFGCGDKDEDEERVEGTEAGDCEDDADNDGDGLFDCDDDGCAGASACDETDTDTETDTETDTDTDTDTNTDSDTDTPCVADLTLSFPDGTSATLDYCQSYSMDATFEFDPDEPPEIRSPTLIFHAVTDTDFECWVQITEPAACGEGYYRMDGTSGAVILDTHDCSGVGDDYEGEYTSSTGYLRMDTFHAGDEPGNFSGDPLEATMAGYVSVQTSEGIALTGDFSMTTEITAGDAEDADCVVSDGDEDADGYTHPYFDGDDCDDDNADAFPGATTDATSGECMEDIDGDGYGGVEPSDGFDPGTDCDDDDAAVFPGATTDATSGECMEDTDGDGYGSVEPSDGFDPGTDCDDGDDRLHPYDADGDGIMDSCGWRVSAGGMHNCALDSSGSIECWGIDDGHKYYDHGQVTDTPTGNGYTAVSAGSYHNCALDSSGGIECWGRDDHGQVTDTPTGNGYTAVSAGSYHSCALDSAGGIECWGWGVMSDTPTDTGYTAVSTGRGGQNDTSNACALDAYGGIECWGGWPYHTDAYGSSGKPTGTGYTTVSIGGAHGCALDSSGSIECVGYDEYGQVSDTPIGSGYTAVSANFYHNCALDSAGGIECWGWDTGYNPVSDTSTGTGYTAVSAGENHNCAIDASGGIDCWGADNYDQVSDSP